MKKVVLKLDIHDEKAKQKAMKIVSVVPGLDSISMDMKEKKLTLTGNIDPVPVVGKLRKLFHTAVLSVGPAASEPEKKKQEDSNNNKKQEQPKKSKQEDSKKKGEEDSKKEKEQTKNNKDQGHPQQLFKFHEPANNFYNQYPIGYYQSCRSMEEDPNACAIC